MDSYLKSSGLILFESLLAMGILVMALLLASYPLFEARNSWRNAVISQYAVHLAFNAINRVRTNNSAATDYGMDYASTSLWGGDESPEVSCSNSCSSSELIQLDANELQQEWQQHTPNAEMSINACGSALCVLLWWDEDHISDLQCIDQNCLRVRFLP